MDLPAAGGIAALEDHDAKIRFEQIGKAVVCANGVIAATIVSFF